MSKYTFTITTDDDDDIVEVFDAKKYKMFLHEFVEHSLRRRWKYSGDGDEQRIASDISDEFFELLRDHDIKWD